MEKLSGILCARLADKGEVYDKSLIEEINSQVKPPRRIGPDDVYIRAMYIVSDQINNQGGCFAPEELDGLTRMMVDSPVMVGHQRDSLPVARNFKAEKVEQNDRIWIKSFFYWMKESDGAEDLKNNIDGGIYKECSISFLFRLPECSICGRDIRECRHIPLREYETASGRRETAHFKYRRIEKVLETSLVFRGAVPETRITDRLSPDEYGRKTEGKIGREASVTGQIIPAALFVKTENDTDVSTRFAAFDRVHSQFEPFDQFRPGESDKPLLVYPHQPGLIFRATRCGRTIELETTLLIPETIRRLLLEQLYHLPAQSFTAVFLLYAVKGNQRRDGAALMQIIESDENLHRLRLRLIDLPELDGVSCLDRPYEQRLEFMHKWFDAGRNNAADHDFIDVLRPRRLSAGRWPEFQRNNLAGKYNFGLEVVVENETGAQVRHVLRRDRLTPARVERITVKSRRHLQGRFVPLGNETTTVSLTCPRMAGLEKGAVVLLDGISDAGGNLSPASIVDILPGAETARMLVISPDNDQSRPAAYVLPDEDSLKVYFVVADRRYRATVHYFSAPLLAGGRKFIADLEELEDHRSMPSADSAVPLSSITQAGGLIHLQPAGSKTIFGDSPGLWLRPVLIDGKSRHLFYAGSAAGLKDLGQVPNVSTKTDQDLS